MFLRRYVNHVFGWDKPAVKNEKDISEEEFVLVESASSSHTAIANAISEQKKLLNDNPYQRELSKTVSDLQKLLKKMKAFKKEMVKDTSLEAHAKYLPEEKEKIKTNVLASVENVVTFLFEVEDIHAVPNETWSALIEGLIDSWNEQMLLFTRHLAADNCFLSSNTKSKEEKRKICLEMVMFNIEIALSLLKLTTNTQDNLYRCYHSKMISEKAINDIAELAIRFLKMPLPSVNCDFNEMYRDLLSDEMDNEKQVARDFIEATLKAAREDEFLFEVPCDYSTDSTRDSSLVVSSSEEGASEGGSLEERLLTQSDSFLFSKNNRVSFSPRLTASENLYIPPSNRR